MNAKPIRHSAHVISRGCGLLAAVWGLSMQAALGQAPQPLPSTYIQQQQLVEQQIRQTLDEYLPPAQRWQVDAGGWHTFYLFNFDDGVEERTQRRHDTRLWAAVSGDRGTHQFYARLQMTYIDWNAGDSYDGNEDDPFGPRADRLWYQFDLRQAIRTYGKGDLPLGMQVKIGRQYVEFGSGYAFSLPVDAVQIMSQVGDLDVRALLANSVKSFPDIDRSRPDSGSMDRHFLGIELRYRGIPKHTPFAYVLWNLDENPTHRFGWPRQGFDYDTFYTGIGSQGELLRNVRYSTELVYESGESYGNGAFRDTDPVNALGFDAILAYLGTGRYRPAFDAEYMFASGDAQRPWTPVSAIGGNQPGTTDTSFNAFGWRDTGLSFAPRLSNIHIWRAGASFEPFATRLKARRLRVGTDWFLYAKNKSGSAVSDFQAVHDATYLGWEMDYYINWQITTEISATARYGAFFPGDAFEQTECRHFVLLGITYSF